MTMIVCLRRIIQLDETRPELRIFRNTPKESKEESQVHHHQQNIKL